MRHLHLQNFINLCDLFIGQILLHYQGLVPLCVYITIPVQTVTAVAWLIISPVLMLQPLCWWDGPLHNEDSPRPLPHPLILYLCNLNTGGMGGCLLA